MTTHNRIVVPRAQFSDPQILPSPTRSPDAPPSAIKAAFVKWREANPATSNVQIARQLGYSPAYVSLYLSKAPEDFPGDYQKFEAAIADFLRGAGLKANYDVPPISTEITHAVSSFADYVRSVGGIGVLHGDAGWGKSVALSMLAQDTKTGILIIANSLQNDARGIKSLLWPHCSHGAKANSNRWAHIVSVLKGSNRLIMVDSAQRLDRSGRNALCDLLDETGCPILLAGNPEIMRSLASDDQQSSRSLPALSVSIRDPKKLVRHILATLIPDHAEELHDEAMRVVMRKGHLRQLVNLVKATKALAANPDFRDKPIKSAWASARALSVAS